MSRYSRDMDRRILRSVEMQMRIDELEKENEELREHVRDLIIEIEYEQKIAEQAAEIARLRTYGIEGSA